MEQEKMKAEAIRSNFSIGNAQGTWINTKYKENYLLDVHGDALLLFLLKTKISAGNPRKSQFGDIRGKNRLPAGARNVETKKNENVSETRDESPTARSIRLLRVERQADQTRRTRLRHGMLRYCKEGKKNSLT
jgi:hypothetical protein